MNEYIVETSGLAKDFRGLAVVRNLSLRIKRGGIHALIGPNGAGKTTVFNLLTRFLEPSAGRIVFDGTDITKSAPADVVRRGLGRSFQISAVFSRMTALQNVRVALQRNLGTSFHFWRTDFSLDVLDGKSAEMLDVVGLSDHANTIAGELSYGRRRALEIATTLAIEPTMLLLDEPMSGLGREDIGRISKLIRNIAVGRTVLLVEHNLPVVSELSDFVTVLNRGEILAEGSYANVSSNKEVQHAYLGRTHV